MSVFYRVHPSDAPALTADNAWSAPWGTTRSADGSQYECIVCDGTGEGTHDCPKCGGGCYIGEFFDIPCDRCDGDGFIDTCGNCDEGWLDCVRGYSCCATPEALIRYFTDAGRSGCADGEQVVVFEGQQEDWGLEGEPTAVPARVIETLSWEAFVARHQQEANA
ncbi:hypothetical protein [Streptomyces hygroscopicus]|uniref:hypothetical protein n=1 Tax=Streptomyces hygroscopicus TaxID=1912 RepID=UPI003405EE7B